MYNQINTDLQYKLPKQEIYNNAIKSCYHAEYHYTILNEALR